MLLGCYNSMPTVVDIQRAYQIVFCPNIWSVDFYWFISATNVYFFLSFCPKADVVFLYLLQESKRYTYRSSFLKNNGQLLVYFLQWTRRHSKRKARVVPWFQDETEGKCFIARTEQQNDRIKFDLLTRKKVKVHILFVHGRRKVHD